MLPNFPEFKKLELSDRKDIEEITKLYPPYSDFDFESLWAWDVSGKFEISTLNGNLVIILAEHFSNQPFYSFLGNNLVNESLLELFAYIEKEPGIQHRLRLVPEVVLKNIDFSKFIIEIDLSNYDYIYNTQHISTYDGPKYAQKRKLFHRFSRNNPGKKIEILDLSNLDIQNNILNLSRTWANNKEAETEGLNLNKEFNAIKRFLAAQFTDNLCIGLFVDNKLIGYQIFTILENNYSICHFGKTDISYHGSFEYMMSESCSALIQRGIELLNTEEDLGLPHLRYSKNSYRPVHFLRKYTIRQF